MTAATAFGLVITTFVRSQIAAIFATAIIVMIPTVNFSGMLYPVATLGRIRQAFLPPYFKLAGEIAYLNPAMDNRCSLS